MHRGCGDLSSGQRGGGGNRTRVQGFAGPCLSHSATPPCGRLAPESPRSAEAVPRADDGIRTRDPHLGKVMRYQLRYVRSPRGVSRCSRTGADSIRSGRALQTTYPRAQPLPHRVDGPPQLVLRARCSRRSRRPSPAAARRSPAAIRASASVSVIPRPREPLQARLSVGQHDHDGVESVARARLDQQRARRTRAWRRPVPADQLGHALADERVDDRVQVGARLLVVEHDLGERGAVEAAVRPTTPVAEPRDHGVETGVPGSTTSRAIASASITTAPCPAQQAATVLLPDPTPPLSPIRTPPRYRPLTVPTRGSRARSGGEWRTTARHSRPNAPLNARRPGPFGEL